MLVLFDQGTPVPIANSLIGHSVETVRQRSWDTLANGELLRVAEQAGFDVLVTTDKNLTYQQNLKGRKIGIVPWQKQMDDCKSSVAPNRGGSPCLRHRNLHYR